MLPVLITLTPGRRNEFVHCQNAKVRIVVQPIMDVETQCNLREKWLERVHRLREFTCEWLKTPKISDYLPLFTPQDEWTIVKYIMEVLRRFWYCTLWMSKRYTVTLYHVITIYIYMFNHTDGVIWALAKKITPWKEHLYFTVKVARQKLSKYHDEVTPMTGLLVISAHILDAIRKLRSYRTWDKVRDSNPEDEIFSTTHYQDAFLQYVQNEYCAQHRLMSVIDPQNVSHSIHFPSGNASGFGQSSFDPYGISSTDEDCLHLKAWLKWHQDKAIAHHADWQPQCSNSIHLLKHHETGGKLIQILMITTPDPFESAVHWGYQISPSGGTSRTNHTQSNHISPTW